MAELLNLDLFLKKYDYISFDVFDTLIKRSVAMPTDLFFLIEQYCKNTGMNIPSSFAKKRREAEQRASEKKGIAVGLEDIYNELRGDYGAATDELKELELRFELDGCKPNPPCAELLHRCVEAGKIVVLISDMYLPSAFIGKMLEKCHIRGYKKLYVSCEMGARKGDGSLFRDVIKELDIHPEQLFHIGDNWKGDFLRPISIGIKAAHIDRGQRFTRGSDIFIPDCAGMYPELHSKYEQI